MAAFPTIDNKLTLGSILTLMTVMIGGATVFGEVRASVNLVNGRADRLEKIVDRHETSLADLRSSLTEIKVSVARSEATLDNVRRDLSRVLAVLEKGSMR